MRLATSVEEASMMNVITKAKPGKFGHHFCISFLATNDLTHGYQYLKMHVRHIFNTNFWCVYFWDMNLILNLDSL
jgi:hypothetical protein